MDDRRGLQRDDTGASRTMIMRTWSARLAATRVPTYVEHLDRSVRPALAALPGFLEVTVLERQLDDSATHEVVVQTRWTSLDAIRAFAGAEISLAVVEPAAAALFDDYDRRVLHFDVIG